MLIVAVVVASLAAGCDTTADEARREYFKALELSKNGAPQEEQLVHVERALQLTPDASEILELRANLLFSLGRVGEARVDYDRTVTLADRPYLRFERADALCALGEYDAALADLDFAIAAQPENTQFYPRRALARLAVGRLADARADAEHAIASGRGPAKGSYARAAVLLMESRPAEAIADLDPMLERTDDYQDGLPRFLRLLAHAALDQRELAAAQFDRGRLSAAAHWPYMGPRYWFISRGCDNAFIPAQAGELLAKAQSIVAASEAALDAPKPAATVATTNARSVTPATPPPAAPPPKFPTRPFLVIESTDTAVFVDLDRKGIDPNAAALATIQLLDDRGVRVAERVAVRKTCAKVCGEDSEEQCHVIGEYRYSGLPVAPFTVAFQANAMIRPHPLDRAPPPHEGQLGHIAQLFANPLPTPMEGDTVFSWVRPDATGDWAEQYAWAEVGRGGRRYLQTERTGAKFADCTLATYGPLTEFACRDRRSTYVGNRHLGGNNDPTLGSLVRYSAEVDGTLAYFVIVDWNSFNYVHIVFRLNDEWHEDGVDEDRTVC